MGAALSLRLHDSTQEEAAYIAAARAGDAAASAWLVRQYTAPVYRFCARMLGNDQDAWDAAQDTLVKVLRKLDRYDDQWRFSTWVFSIARNTCIDEHRRRKPLRDQPSEQIPDSRPGPLELTSRQERAERLHGALDDLSPLYREVLVLYHFEHLKYEEIATALSIPIGTVMNRIFRARKKLREAYEAQGGDVAAQPERP